MLDQLGFISLFLKIYEKYTTIISRFNRLIVLKLIFWYILKSVKT